MVTEQVTFTRPFRLPDMDRPHPAGTFDLVIEREALDLSWPAYRLGITIMLTGNGTTEAWRVSRDDLDAALAADRAEQSTHS